jgi:hypothetical protein
MRPANLSIAARTIATRTIATRTSAALALALVAAATTGPAWASGRISVKWIEPEKFSDAGRSAFDRERTLQSLEQHLQDLSKRLPSGQVLTLEVTDLELAGEIEPFGRFHQDVRVLRGGADWPRIALRYTLADGARTLKSGEAHLSEPHYFFRTLRGTQSGALGYEKRMLDEWVTTLVAQAPAKP